MQQGKSSSSSTVAMLGVAGGAVVVIGSFLTWAKVSLDLAKFAQLLNVPESTLAGAIANTSRSVKGTEVDGKITLVLGILAIVGAVLVMRAVGSRITGSVLAIVGGAGASLDAIYNIVSKDRQINDALSKAGPALSQIGISADAFKGVFSVTWGIGIYSVIVGGVLAVIGGVMLMRSQPTPVAMPGTPIGGGLTGFEAPAPPPASIPPPSTPPPPPVPPAPGQGGGGPS